VGGSDGGIFSLFVIPAVRSRSAASCVTSIAQLPALFDEKSQERCLGFRICVCSKKGDFGSRGFGKEALKVPIISVMFYWF
jgi:hypothetical protein